MKLFVQTLTLCLALLLSFTAASHHEEEHGQKDKHHDKGHDHEQHHDAKLDRCAETEFDAAVVNEEGVLYFFKGNQLFKGFHGKAEPFNKTFPEMDDHHHVDHVDAAFRMSKDSPDHHYHLFFITDNKVFNFCKQKLEDGYPKGISEVFPGIPEHVDAAVECSKPKCPEETVIFFDGKDMYNFDKKTKKVDKKEFKGTANCTGALRYLDNYYCLHGHQFSKFDPITGEVHDKYPKEFRDYFMRCIHFGNKTEEEHIEREQCSRVHLDAITSDDDGNTYAFRGHHFLSKTGDKFHADTIDSAFKEVHSDVDAVFSYDSHFYIVKGDQVFVYTVGEPHKLLEGYPKPLKEVLGIEGPIDAAFVCADHQIVHIVKGETIYNVDMKATPHAPAKEGTITTYKKIDTAMCGPKGVSLVVGNHYYTYPSVMVMLMGKIKAEPHKVSQDLFGCDH